MTHEYGRSIDRAVAAGIVACDDVVGDVAIGTYVVGVAALAARSHAVESGDEGIITIYVDGNVLGELVAAYVERRVEPSECCASVTRGIGGSHKPGHSGWSVTVDRIRVDVQTDKFLVVGHFGKTLKGDHIVTEGETAQESVWHRITEASAVA